MIVQIGVANRSRRKGYSHHGVLFFLISIFDVSRPLKYAYTLDRPLNLSREISISLLLSIDFVYRTHMLWKSLAKVLMVEICPSFELEGG